MSRRWAAGRAALALALAGVLAVGTTGIAEADDATDVLHAIERAAPEALDQVARVEAETGGEVALAATFTEVAVEVPRDPADAILVESADGGTLEVGLPFAEQAQPADAEGAGVVSYENDNATTTVPIVNADGSIQILTVIDDASAPTEFAYPISVPGGARLSATDDGGAVVVDPDGLVVAVIAAPWATDARGDAVATSYEIRGSTLIQHVAHDAAGVDYPVVADPTLSYLWWGIATKLTRTETKLLAARISTSASGIAAFCGFVPVVAARVACGLGIAWRIASWIDPVRQAAAQNRCVQINLPYGSGPGLWNVTNEAC